MRTFRNRLRHKHLKALSTGSMAGLTTIFLMICFVSTSDSSWFSYRYWDFEADTVIWVKQSAGASARGRR